MNQNPRFQTMIKDLTKAMAKSRQDRINNIANYTKGYRLGSDNELGSKKAQDEARKIQQQKQDEATQSEMKMKEELAEEKVFTEALKAIKKMEAAELKAKKETDEKARAAEAADPSKMAAKAAIARAMTK